MKTFKQKVYDVVCKIPAGRTMTYAEVAQKAGNKKAARAAGNIIHDSPSDVPCHRVISKSGNLSKSFGKGGIDKQRELLQKEDHKITNNRII